MDAWPSLPPALRAGILAMVRAATGASHEQEIDGIPGSPCRVRETLEAARE
jgi:hypothetical protein